MDTRQFYTLITAGGLLLLTALFFLFKPSHTVYTVEGTHYTLTESLQSRTTVHGEDWGSPSDAFNVSCQRRYYGQEPCNPHDCNCHYERFGHSEEWECSTCWDSCAEYRDWCSYDRWVWTTLATVTTSGSQCESISWPAPPKWPHCNRDGYCNDLSDATRRTSNVGDYSVRFVAESKSLDYSAPDTDTFCQYTFGDQWRVKETTFGKPKPELKIH